MKISLITTLILFSNTTQAYMNDYSIYSRAVKRTKTQHNVVSQWNKGGCKVRELEEKLKSECFEDGYTKCVTTKRKQTFIFLNYLEKTGFVTKDNCEITIKGYSPDK